MENVSSIEGCGKPARAERPCEDSVMVSVRAMREKLSGEYRPLSVQALIPGEFENVEALPNRIPKSVVFSMIRAFAGVSVLCFAGFLSRAISTRP